jgi:2-oxoisovalerate dehydrogenase E1 component alpha subunit
MKFKLEPKKLIQIHDLMVKSRVLEERLIRMYKQNDGYFWIGGPGEEAFSVPLGMQVSKGMGLDHDFLHLHYRSSPIMLCMGAEPIDSMRQMKNVATDPYSGGRNFANHYSKRDWNVVPVSSTIETQYLTAIGTAIGQTKEGCKGITIVNGGDSGTAEGDFASALVWASRPALPLPMLMIVTNNGVGISTPHCSQFAGDTIAARGNAFGIKNKVINGNDVEESYFELEAAIKYVREERKPFLLEARVSRLYGHSSASGANFVSGEEDSLLTFEKNLEAAKILTRAQMDKIREDYTATMLEQSKGVKHEPMPSSDTIYDHVYYGQKGRYW